MSKFRVEYYLEVILDEDRIWPDGDIPIDPAKEDVANAMERYGLPYEVIQDWNFHTSNNFGKFKVSKLTPEEAAMIDVIED